MKRNNWTQLISGLSVLTLVACSPSGEAAEGNGTAKAPAARVTRSIDGGTRFSMAMMETITSRTAKAGDAFSATVVADVQDDAGRVAIPAGSVISGTIAEVKSAPNPQSSGTLTLTVNGLTVHGKYYPLDAIIDSLATERAGRAISGGDVAKVGAGAAAGAIVGQIIGKNTRGTVIGAVAGGAAGAGYAVATKDSDIVLPAGTHVIVTLMQRLTVAGS